MGIPMVGSTYPTVTGENTPKGAAFTRIVVELPGLQIWSVYYDGSDLPSWSEEWFKPQYDHIRYFLVSVKTSDVNAFGARLAQIPIHLRGRIVALMHHEPDQWRSDTDPRGDPSPSVWWLRQLTFLNLRETSSWASWVKYAVCLTEDRARTDRVVWDTNWGNRVLSEGRIDFVMFDCFNLGRSIVRQGSDIFGIPVSYGRAFMQRHNRTAPCVMVREYGQVTPTDSPADSTAVAQGIAENWEYAKANADVIAGLVWFYNHNNTLTDPSGTRPGRPLTLGVVQGMLEEATTPAEVPDPNHPQYQFGYQAGHQAGRDSRQSEVDTLTQRLADANAAVEALESDVADLTGQLTDAENRAATAKAQGRLEAFGEVVNWAQTQS